MAKSPASAATSAAEWHNVRMSLVKLVCVLVMCAAGVFAYLKTMPKFEVRY